MCPPACTRSFLPSLPARGATRVLVGLVLGDGISTLAPREGSDYFLPASRVETVISTLAPREGSDRKKAFMSARPPISTLAPREGSDPASSPSTPFSRYFYPRSPRGERQSMTPVRSSKVAFLPSLPARGATCGKVRPNSCITFLPSLPARGATTDTNQIPPRRSHFYPRSPRGERLLHTSLAPRFSVFLPSLPARGATALSSAHAL